MQQLKMGARNIAARSRYAALKDAGASAAGAARACVSRGLFEKELARLRGLHIPNGRAKRAPKPIEERFWSKVDRNGPIPAHRPELGPCHVWTGGCSTEGYGCFWFQGKLHRSSRVAFYLEHGRWPEPECCHHCDNPACVNDAHLFEGTHDENMADMDAKGRRGTACGDRSGARRHPERLARGERHGRSKLTEQAVRDMRAEYADGDVSQRELGRKHGLDHKTIGAIVRRKTWAHV